MKTTPRFDIYAPIHKGLRAFMSHVLVRVGRLDPHDPTDVAEAGAELRSLLEVCQHHLEKENAHVHPALRERAPGSIDAADADHREHERSIAALREQLARVGGDVAAARALYQMLARFVAENLEHMAHEETAHNAALWATHTDAEIMAIEHRIVASLKPEEAQVTMRWMLPHLTPEERAGMLGGMRQAAPAEVFEGVINLVRPLLGGREWRKLNLALGL